MKRELHLDELLREWEFDPQNLSVRLTKGDDDRDVIQMRVDLGILQMETTDRPDGHRPEGFDTYLDLLLAKALENPDLELDEFQCNEVDREFMQFYHRRICWLRLQYYRRAVIDADHTLRLMDVSRDLSPDEEWTVSHEQYRPFVLFHRTQAEALAELEDNGAEAAMQAITRGLDRMKSVFAEHDVEDHFETDELVVRLTEFRESLRKEYGVGRTLHEQLADAVASEQYELAARLRDKLARRDGDI